MTDTPETLQRRIARLAQLTRAWEPRDTHRLRRRIADAILRALPILQARDTYWAKLNLVHACRELDHNVQIEGRGGRSDMWLLPSLISLRYSLLPKGTYNEKFTGMDPKIDALSFETLAKLVRQELRQYA